jgi:hypothetical protein
MTALDIPTLSRSPSLAPSFREMLRDADALLALMGSEPLCVVADLADQLTACANDAGAREIANAASAVSRIASRREGVALTGPMHDLTNAIAHAQDAYRLDAAE